MRIKATLLSILLALACVAPLHAQQPSALTLGSKPVQVTFWNIEWFPGSRPKASQAEEQRQIPLVQREVAKLAPDLFGMAEVRDWAAAELAIKETPGLKLDVCSDFTVEAGHPGAQQVALASRLPAIAAWAEPFTRNDAVHPPRGFAFAAYQPAPGRVLLAYSVHFKSNRGELEVNIAQREESARQLLSHVEAMKKAFGGMGAVTVVLGGDFNTSLDDPRFKDEKTLTMLQDAGFTWAWKGIAPAGRVTLPASGPFPDACFDHIFFQGAKLQRAHVSKPPEGASDHNPINARLELAGAR